MRSEQVVQRKGFAPVVFFNGLSCHSADHIGFFGKALLPGFFIRQRCEDLRCNRVLFILREGDDFLQRLLQKPRHALILPTAMTRPSWDHSRIIVTIACASADRPSPTGPIFSAVLNFTETRSTS